MIPSRGFWKLIIDACGEELPQFEAGIPGIEVECDGKLQGIPSIHIICGEDQQPPYLCPHYSQFGCYQALLGGGADLL